MDVGKILVASSSAFVSGIQPEAVWNIWSDVPNWPSWDHNFKATKLNGSFAIDGIIEIFHKHYPNPTLLRICNIEKNKRFDTESNLNFGDVTVERELIFREGGVKLTHSFYLLPRDDQMKKMFETNIAHTVRIDFENAVKNIAELVEKA